ncbi:MAG: sigma 54-interacting transcriptional regulator [Polyangiaceae bacterium]|nr:sigma 54-interacting transcriptional regulator [Polyangiaceae bacterium]
MPHLIVRQPGRTAQPVPLLDSLRIGRHEQNDLVLNDDQVSRHHAVIARTAEGFEIRDLDSRHGLLVNSQKAAARRLLDGDAIQIGNVLLEFHDDEAPQHIVHQIATAAAAPSGRTLSDRRLELIYQINRAVSAASDTGAWAKDILETLAGILGCERVLLGLGSAEKGVIQRFEHATTTNTPAIVVSRAVLEATLGQRKAVLVRDAQRDAAQKTMHKERIRSAMAVPIGLGATAAGILYVDDRQHTERFDVHDLEFLTAIGQIIGAALESIERHRRAEAMAETLAVLNGSEELIGKSAKFLQLKAQIAKFGRAHAHALVRGESGSGKELVARALHAASPRAARPFLAVNCAAIPDTMIEAELFGYEKGAFTGSLKAKRGHFVLADGGTLFLDEIGDLALPAQAKLLRAVQEGEVLPLGSERPVRVDVRIISATHKDLVAEVAAQRFREDLYYRLQVIEIDVPPLREREGDVALLASAFLGKASAAMGKKLEGFTESAIAALLRHDWPGNVRELRNEIERCAIQADGPLVEAYDLSPRLGAAARRIAGQPRTKSLAERFAELEPTEKELVEAALEQAKGNTSEAARLLGITRIMIRRRIERFGLRAKDDE